MTHFINAKNVVFGNNSSDDTVSLIASSGKTLSLEGLLITREGENTVLRARTGKIIIEDAIIQDAVVNPLYGTYMEYSFVGGGSTLNVNENFGSERTFVAGDSGLGTFASHDSIVLKGSNVGRTYTLKIVYNNGPGSTISSTSKIPVIIPNQGVEVVSSVAVPEDGTASPLNPKTMNATYTVKQVDTDAKIEFYTGYGEPNASSILGASYGTIRLTIF